MPSALLIYSSSVFSTSSSAGTRISCIHSFIVSLISFDSAATLFSNRILPVAVSHTIIPEPMLLRISFKTSYDESSELLVTLIWAILWIIPVTSYIKCILSSLSDHSFILFLSYMTKCIASMSLILIGTLMLFSPFSAITSHFLASSIHSPSDAITVHSSSEPFWSNAIQSALMYAIVLCNISSTVCWNVSLDSRLSINSDNTSNFLLVSPKTPASGMFYID